MMHHIDISLLETAAMAAGLYYWRDGDALMTHGDDPGACRPWNPLADDGDALRLAVRVNLEMCIAAPITYARMAMQEGISATISEFHGADAMAATRRAIVRAAAALSGEGGEG